MIIGMNYIEIRNAARRGSLVSFSSGMDIFTHHFPENPLLPGALSAQLMIESCGCEGWSLKKINGLRFRKPLTPELVVSISCTVTRESETEKICTGKIQSGIDIIADGEFVFVRAALSRASGAHAGSMNCVWNVSQIREYLPHGETIVLIDELVEVRHPSNMKTTAGLDQSKLVGTKIHTRSMLKPKSFWLDQNEFPPSVLAELVAQASALTLAPFFTGTKPRVSLLGCDTEYFALAQEGATIDTFLELTRIKRLGKSGNMIIFKSECYAGETKLAEISLNAMASF